MTSHENFLSNAKTCRRALSGVLDGERLRTLISVPLFHVTGCNLSSCWRCTPAAPRR